MRSTSSVQALPRFALALALACAGTVGGWTPSHAGSPAWIPTLVVPPQSITDASAFADGTAIVYVEGSNLLFRSRDFGSTWRVLRSPPSTGVTSTVRMATPAVGIMSSNGLVFRTDDGGDSWHEIPGPGDPENLVFDGSLAVSDGGQTIVIGGSMVEGVVYLHTGMFRSQDGGGSWSFTDLPYAGAVEDIRFLNSLDGVALVREGTTQVGGITFSQRILVVVTHDGGATFDVVLTCPHNTCTTSGMATSDWFVIGTSEGRTFVTQDGGATFQEGQRLAGPVPRLPGTRYVFWVQGIGFAGAKTGYASTKGAGTWRTDDGGLTWVLELSGEIVFAPGIGDLAVADADHAIAAGPLLVSTRRANILGLP